MGRKKQFDLTTAINQIQAVFIAHGYEGASIDDFVTATGILRGSLYATFGSKRGLFVAALQTALETTSSATDQLILIAMTELSWRDPEINARLQSWLTNQPNWDARLTTALLQRAHLTEE